MALVPASSHSTGDGQQTVTCIRFPIAFNTPGLVPASFPIIAVDVPALTVTVAGNRTAALAVGVAFVIAGSSANDQSGTVVTASLVGGNTVINGSFFFLDPTVDGNVVVSVGATVYTPTIGDCMLAMDTAPDIRGTISQAWNGAGPVLRLTTETGRRAQAYFQTPINVTVADSDLLGTGTVFGNFPGFAATSAHRLLRFAAADPLLAWVDNNSGLDPGSTQGAGEIEFLIFNAA